MIIAVLAVIAVVIMYFKIFRSKHILDGPGMINTREGEITGVYLVYSGEKNGEYKMYRLTEQPDRAVLFEYEYRPAMDDTTTSGSTVLPEGTLDTFRAICRRTECLITETDTVPDEKVPGDTGIDIVFYLGEKSVHLNSNCNYPQTYDGLFENALNEFERLSQTEH